MIKYGSASALILKIANYQCTQIKAIVSLEKNQLIVNLEDIPVAMDKNALEDVLKHVLNLPNVFFQF